MHRSRKYSVEVFSCGTSNVGKVTFAKLQIDLDAVSNFLAAADGILEPRERLVHLFRPAQEELVSFHSHAIDVGAKAAGIDAQEHVLRLGIFAVHVMGIARGHQRQSHPLRDVDSVPSMRHPLDFQAIILDFDESSDRRMFAETRRRFFRFRSNPVRAHCRAIVIG